MSPQSRSFLLGAADHAADAYYNLGVALKTSDPDESLASYERALACDARHARAAQNAGVAALERGDAPRAVAFFERALEAEPRDEHIAANLALARRRLPGRPDAAAPLDVATRELKLR